MRVKGGTIHRARRKKALKQAKGYFGSKHRLYKTAKEQVMHSGAYAYRDRKARKRDFRKLWITRINAACRLNEISYSKFINGLSKAGIEVNRKMLAEIAIDNPKAFAELVNAAKAGLDGKTYTAKAIEKDTAKKEVAKKEVKKSVKKEATKKEETKKSSKKEETKKSSKKEEKIDLSSLTVSELKKMAKEKDVNGYSTMKKAELIDALK
ncbi:MAG: 50S ribosomal protein L20 [Bacilli bacterium]|nr:50S ribosomal protein L20 [Bacilli bacterium]